MGDKHSLVLYTDFPKTTAGLSDAVFREIVCAACHYTETGEVPDMSPEGQIAFPFIKTTLDRDAEKWEQERKARSEAGKKGMASRWGHKTDNKQ